MYQALYRKYRPKNFDDVVGQEVIIKTLTNAIKNDKVSHAYLFTGPRGTGKTSIAKIYAKILNCENLKDLIPCEKCISCTQINNNQNIDVIEIDAASNNGVDEIREIRNKIGLVPSNSKYKIYIIDEVHMLTNQAFNALLKTLEEPPSHIIFIFATTEPHKIPRTILSRCQKFDFKKISNQHIVDRLKHIAEIENIKITEEALNEIAVLADGGLRDSIGMLDQAVSYSNDEITLKDIHDINGTLDKEEIRQFLQDIFTKNMVSLLEKIEVWEEQGKNIVKITQELIDEFKNILLYKNVPEFFSTDKEYYEQVKDTVNNTQIYRYIQALSELIGNMKNSSNNKILLEIEIIKMMDEEEILPPKEEKTSVKQVTEESEPIFRKEQIDEKQTKIETEEKKEKPKKTTSKQNVDTNSFLSKEAQEQLNELKKIRINNSLISVSQKNRNQFKEKMEELKELLMDPDYSKIISLLFDGDLKAISDKNIIFAYQTPLLAEAFNLELVALEKIFEEKFHEKYALIAVDLEEWNQIKTEYNKKKNSYQYLEETVSLNDIFAKKEQSLNNSIDDLFDNFVEYEEK